MGIKIKLKQKSGFGLIEVIVGITIISLSLFGLMAVSQITSRVVDESSRSIKVSFLLEEGVEAVKILRDSTWTTNIAPLGSATDYYLEFTGSIWQTTSSNIYIDDLFERKFVLDDVYRDVNQDIASSGVLDPDTKKVTVFVSWREKNRNNNKKHFYLFS